MVKKLRNKLSNKIKNITSNCRTKRKNNTLDDDYLTVGELKQFSNNPHVRNVLIRVASK